MHSAGFYLIGLNQFFVFQRERRRADVGEIVVAGMVVPALGVKNIEEKAFRPLVAKRERLRHEAAA